MSNEVNAELAQKVLDVVNAGLVSGVGEPIPGKMCVEAAVCYAMGLPHSDQPSCVGEAVRKFKIRLNDAQWSSNEARTNGLRKLAIAQLGSSNIDQKAFAKIVAEKTIRKIIPPCLRNAATSNPVHAGDLKAAAVSCETEGTEASAWNAYAVARSAAYGSVAASASAASASAAYAAADSAASAASGSVSASAYAAVAASAAAYAAAVSADSAASGSASADGILHLACQIGLDALIELRSPGCEFLYLIPAE